MTTTSFISKLADICPISRSDMITKIKRVVPEALLRVIDTHNTASIIFIFILGGETYLMKAEYGQHSATRKEIMWYKTIPAGVSAPRFVASFEFVDWSYLILDYVEKSATIDELVFAGEADWQEIAHYIIRALQEDERLLRKDHNPKKNRAQCDELLSGRYYKRCAEAASFPYLHELMCAPRVCLNGRLLRSPGWYVARVQKDSILYHYLTPDTLGLIHGDLHCGNILVKDDEIFLIDPNGMLEMPLEYDYGKMFHTIHGNYDAIMRKAYRLDSFGHHHYALEINAPIEYEKTQAVIKDKISVQLYHRSMYAEAIHFASLLPHHAKERMETIALYLRCVQIFDELFTNLGIMHA